MWVPLAGFLVTSALCYGIMMIFVRGGKDRDGEVPLGVRRRPLIFGPLTAALAGVLPCPSGTRELLSRFLRQAGHYHRQALAEFLALRNTLLVGWVLLVATVVVVAVEPGDPDLWWIAAGGAIVGLLLYSLPRLVLEMAGKNRLRRIEESLPDALDMITMCMSGGLPLQTALARVSGELHGTHPDLAFELRVVGRHMETGSLDAAIKQFAQRIDAPEVHSLAAIIGQTGRQGSGVSAAFEMFADNVRLTRRQRADEIGNKTAVKMLFPLVFCLAPPVYIMLLSPAAIELADFIKRESKPGGAISASAENIEPLLQGTPVEPVGRRHAAVDLPPTVFPVTFTAPGEPGPGATRPAEEAPR